MSKKSNSMIQREEEHDLTRGNDEQVNENMKEGVSLTLFYFGFYTFPDHVAKFLFNISSRERSNFLVLSSIEIAVIYDQPRITQSLNGVYHQ